MNTIMTASLCTILFALFIGFTAINSPYSWSMAFNAFYYTGLHIIWVFANAFVVLMLLFNGFPTTKRYLSRPFFIGAGKLCYTTSLITPLMIQLIYAQYPDGLFEAMVGVNEYAIGNVFMILFVGMLLYLLFEFPFRRLLEWSVLASISNDKAKHAYFVSLFKNIRNRVGSYGPQKEDKLGEADLKLLVSSESASSKHRSMPNNINQTIDTSHLSEQSPLVR